MKHKQTICDVCRDVQTTEVHYVIERHDQVGYLDTFDVCSAECLATMAVGEGHERGERDGFKVGMSQPRVAPKGRRWWKR